MGACVVGLALIPLLVSPEHLVWTRWWVTIIGLAVVGVGAIFVQALVQSREDHERAELEGERDKKIDGLTGMVKKLAGIDVDTVPNTIPATLAPPAPDSATQTTANIDGEVYRIALSPKTMAWELVRDIYRVQGRPDAAQIDCDVLVELYLVNASKTETRYVRDLHLTADVGGTVVSFLRQDDLRAMDIDNKKFEYGIQEDLFDTKPVKQLFSALPITLAPMQPIEGWVRFLAKGINPDKITEKSWHLSVLDSLGNEYPITKAGQREIKGEIALRRLRD